MFPAKFTVHSQAAAPRLQARLLSKLVTKTCLRMFHGTAIHRDSWPAIAVAAPAKDATDSKAPNIQAAAVSASNVKAAFAETGLSQDAIDHIVRQYPSYLRWKVEDKLLPAIQSWQQELGASFLSEFVRVPKLLNKKPAEELLKNQYLLSIGIKSPERLRKRNPHAFGQSWTSIQSKVAFLQDWGFTRAQTLSLIEAHPNVLQGSSKHNGELLGLFGDMFDCANRETLCDIVLSCTYVRLFNRPTATLHRNFTYFCACVGVEHKQMKQAWKHGVFSVSPADLDARLSSIAAQLSATLDKAKGVVRSMPALATSLPETVGLHVTQLLGLGFSHDQVKRMCLRQPRLLNRNYTSDVNVEKWGFLTRILRLSHDAIAAKPFLLTLSLPNRLGPRWEYLQQLRLHGETAFTGSIGSLMSVTDTKFRAANSRPQLRVYDEQFQKQWQQRWNFLRVAQQLSIQDIADNPELLQISLKDT